MPRRRPLTHLTHAALSRSSVPDECELLCLDSRLLQRAAVRAPAAMRALLGCPALGAPTTPHERLAR